MIPEMT